ncbi:RNA-directed DNA polymerase, eukaryota, reverse transcriptase zinc-binding domain protein [Tanacetum coccineum]
MHDAKMVKDFRPITLIKSLYKIIAKILANHLVAVLGDIVKKVQSAFVANRQILDGPFILNELFHWCKKKNNQTIIFKVDFKKAYDLVRWDHLDDLLKIFGFGDRWCGWIQSCLRSSRGSVLVNRNDVVFMGHWSDSNIDTIVQVLECFYRASGLHIIMNKSKLIGISVANVIVDQAAANIGCTMLEAPFSYLGSKVGGLMSRVQSWNEIVNNLVARLSNWKMKTLSIEMKQLKNHDTDLIGFIHKKMSNGVDTSFWEDAWRGDGAFKSLYPRIYALETCKNVTVAVKMSHENVGYSLRRIPRGGIEHVQFLEFSVSMKGVALVAMRDRWVWSLEGSGEFLVASVRRLIDERWLTEV